MIRLPATLLFSAFFLAAWMQAQTVDVAGSLASESVDLGPQGVESPMLEVSGACPGPLLVGAIGLTPAGRVVFAGSLGRGSSVLGAGVCKGTIVDLAEPRVLAVLNADFLGEASLVVTVPRSLACDTITLQALDLATCMATQPVGL